MISNDGLEELTDRSIEYSNVDFNGAKLLVVDDIQHNRDLIRSYVESNNIEFFEADRGDTSVSIAAQIMPDCILMDLRMPGISGYEATESIRKIQGLENVPVIAFTASSMINEDELIHKTFAGYLRKPINRADLFGYLSLFFEKKVPEQENDTDYNQDVKDVENFNMESLKNNQILLTKVVPIIDSHLGFWDHDSIVAVSSCLDEVYADTRNPLARKVQDKIDYCLNNFDFEPIEGIMSELKKLIEI